MLPLNPYTIFCVQTISAAANTPETALGAEEVMCNNGLIALWAAMETIADGGYAS